MPKFAVYDPSEQGINFTGRSQGFTSPLEVIGKSMKGLAQTVSLFQENKAKEDKNKLLQAADAGADEILSGVPTDVNPYGVTPQPGDREGRDADIPVGLQSGLDNFNRYARAYSKGGNSDIDIYAKMAAVAKQLKAKFPGHVDDVDNYIMSALNSKPANVIRKELNSMLDAEARKQAEGSDSTEKFYRQWAKDNTKYLEGAGYKPGDLDFSNEKQMMTVWNHVSKIQADDLETERTGNRLKLDNEVGVNQTKQWKQLGATEIGNKIDQSLRAGAPEFDAFIKSKTDAQSPNSPGGVNVTPEEQTIITQQFGAISSALKLQANSLINGDKYLKNLPNKQDRDDILSAVDARLGVYQDMLDHKLYGLFGGVSQQIKSKYDQTELEVLTGKYGDYTKIVMEGQKIGIPLEAIDAALTKQYGEAGLGDMKLEAARRFVTTGVATGSVPNLGEAMSDAKKDGVVDPQFFNKTLEDMSFILTDPNQDPKIVTNAAKSVYQSRNNDQLLKQFTGRSQKQVFARLTDPRIFARLKGTPEYALAETWAKNQFTGLHREDMDTVVENQNSIGAGVGVLFDPKTSTFKVTIDTELFLGGPTNPLLGSPGNPEGLPELGPEFARAEKLKTALINMNADLSRIHEIVKNGDSGLDPAEETKLLLHLGGFGKLPKHLQDQILEGPAEGEPKPASEGPSKRSIVGASRPDVQEADDFLAAVSSKPREAIEGLDDNFSKSLASLLQAAPLEIKQHLGVFSAKRSSERQKELWTAAVKKYGSEDAARKWVAPPGRSFHEKGLAADLSYAGKSLSKAPADVVRWLHNNAEQFGLTFPLGNENWHIEALENRKKK